MTSAAIKAMRQFLSTPSVGRATSPQPHQPSGFGFLSTPSVGRATMTSAAIKAMRQFLSTPSVGRATHQVNGAAVQRVISIHALRGEGDWRPPAPPGGQTISIHALRGEGDPEY